MAGPTIGYATLSIIPSARGFGAALRGETRGPMEDAGKESGGLFSSAFKVAAVAGIGLAVAGIGLAAKGAFAAIDFDQQMREVFTLMPGISGDAMTEMTDQVKDFSKEFGVLPQEVVPALYQSISAGVPADNVFSFLETAQQAAKGGVTDLTTAVDGISSVVNAYGTDVLDATQASDLMFTAVRLGKTNFEELSSSLFQVTPTAAALGVQFGDVTAGLAALTAQGVPTSVATTQMRQLFIELSKEGGAAANVFEEMAGKSFKDFIAEGGNTAEALDLMVLAAADANVGVNDLFGSVEAGSAALALAGSEVFVDNIDAMGDSTGATAAAFDTMNQGLRPLIDRFKAWGAVMLIEIGERVIPIIERVVEIVQRNWPQISAVISTVMATVSSVVSTAIEHVRVVLDGIIAWVQANWTTIQAVFETSVTVIAEALETLRDGFVAAFGWLMDNQEVLIGIAVALGVGIVALFTSWAISAGAAALATLAAAAPFIAIGVVIAAVVAGVIHAYQEWDWFRGVVDGVALFITGTLVPAFQSIWSFITNSFIPAIISVWNWVKDMWDRLEGFRGFLVGALQLAVDAVVLYYTTWWQVIETVYGWALDLWNRLAGFRAFLATVFTVAISAVTSAFDAVWTAISTVWGWAQTLWAALEPLRDFMAGVFLAAIDGVSSALGGIVGALSRVADFAVSAYNALKRLMDLAPHGGYIGPNNSELQDYLASRGVPGNALGTNYWRGGPTWVGERGPELMSLPRGTQIMDNRASMRLAAQMGTGAGGSKVGMQVENQHFHSGLDLDTAMRTVNLAMAASA